MSSGCTVHRKQGSESGFAQFSVRWPVWADGMPAGV